MIFGERLNAYQWTGVALALVSLFLLSRSSRREGVDLHVTTSGFCSSPWRLVTGAVSGLYDKYIMARLDPVFVQSWYNLYQLGDDVRRGRHPLVAPRGTPPPRSIGAGPFR